MLKKNDFIMQNTLYKLILFLIQKCYCHVFTYKCLTVYIQRIDTFSFLSYFTCLCDRVFLYFVLGQKLWPFSNFNNQKKEVGNPEHTHGESISSYDQKKNNILLEILLHFLSIIHVFIAIHNYFKF